jgi:hypothetical protein
MSWRATPAPEPRITRNDGTGLGDNERVFATFDEAREYLADWWAREAASDKQRWQWSMDSMVSARALKEPKP